MNGVLVSYEVVYLSVADGEMWFITHAFCYCGWILSIMSGLGGSATILLILR